MKTKFLFAVALIFSTITFAQSTKSSKKGYDYYQNSGSRNVSATDYNSSRSNKRGVSASQDYNGTRSNRRSTATDYNSSRSNKSEKSGTRATDYNSSRSNKRGVSASPYGNGNDFRIRKRPRRTKATDYNSSRSNKQG